MEYINHIAATCLVSAINSLCALEYYLCFDTHLFVLVVICFSCSLFTWLSCGGLIFQWYKCTYLKQSSKRPNDLFKKVIFSSKWFDTQMSLLLKSLNRERFLSHKVHWNMSWFVVCIIISFLPLYFVIFF